MHVYDVKKAIKTLLFHRICVILQSKSLKLESQMSLNNI